MKKVPTVEDFVKNVQIEHGYIKINKGEFLYSQGNLLQWTGCLLLGLSMDMGMSYTKFIIDSNAFALALQITQEFKTNNLLKKSVMPRTWSKTDVSKYERKTDIWREYAGEYWRSEDVSDSQEYYMLAGLLEANTCANRLNRAFRNTFPVEVLRTLVKNKWRVKGLDLKTNTDNGNFHNFESTGLRKLHLDILYSNEFGKSGIGFFSNIILKFNKYIMTRVHLDPDSDKDTYLNIAIPLYFMGYRSLELKYFLEEKNKRNLDSWDESYADLEKPIEIYLIDNMLKGF